MENVKQILDELDDGYKYFAIKKDGCWYKIEFDSFMVKDIERAQNICSELNQMLKNACEGKEADTCENNALLPDVSACKTMALSVGDKVRITCEKFGHKFKIGEEVYITEVRPEENNYQATNDESSWAIEDEELVKCE